MNRKSTQSLGLQALPFLALSLLLLSPAGSHLSAQEASSKDSPSVLKQSFDKLPGQTQEAPYAVVRAGKGAGPQFGQGLLALLNNQASQVNGLYLQTGSKYARRRLELRCKFRVSAGADGFAFCFVPSKHFAGKPQENVANISKWAPKAWEEPNIPGALAIAFDIYNPHSKSPFDALGNIYKRPQREVSLHWDGRERRNRLSPVEFRNSKGLLPLTIVIDFVTGGAEVSVKVAEQFIYQREFLATVQPYACHLFVGARTGGVASQLLLDDLSWSLGEAAEKVEAPSKTVIFDKAMMDNRQRQRTPFTAPAKLEQAGRLILRYALSKPENGWDPWDRSASISAKAKDGTVTEIARLITPYAREWEWYFDVTDLAPVLAQAEEIEAYICSWTGRDKGYLLDLDLLVYHGPHSHQPTAVSNLWVGGPKYGDPKNPIANFFKDKTVTLKKDTTRARLRFVVTGHGQAPNTGNAAEFLNRRRWVEIYKDKKRLARFENRLWRQDCYLNPCRPQGGTWKYDRAGWAPGAPVRPWVIDISEYIKGGETLTIRYIAEKYENKHKQNGATHWVASQLLEAKAAPAKAKKASSASKAPAKKAPANGKQPSTKPSKKNSKKREF